MHTNHAAHIASALATTRLVVVCAFAGVSLTACGDEALGRLNGGADLTPDATDPLPGLDPNDAGESTEPDDTPTDNRGDPPDIEAWPSPEIDAYPSDSVSLPSCALPFASTVYHYGEGDIVYYNGVSYDVFEATTTTYMQCVNEGGCTRPNLPTSEAPPPDYDRPAWISDLYLTDKHFKGHPVVGVNVDQARDYCLWRGGRLPTAYEWRDVTSHSGRDEYPWDRYWNYNANIYWRAEGFTCTTAYASQNCGSFGTGWPIDVRYVGGWLDLPIRKWVPTSWEYGGDVSWTGLVHVVGNVSEYVDCSADQRECDIESISTGWGIMGASFFQGSRYYLTYSPDQDGYNTPARHSGWGITEISVGIRCAYDCITEETPPCDPSVWICDPRARLVDDPNTDSDSAGPDSD